MKIHYAATAAAALALTQPALAQQAATVSGDGYPLAEGAVLHPEVGLELGYISNLFYEADSNAEVSTAVMRVLAGLDISSLGNPDTASATRPIDYNLGAHLRYEEFLSDDESARDQRNLSADLGARLDFVPGRSITPYVEDNFIRTNRPPNFEANEVLTRHINRFKAGLRWAPRARTFRGELNYQNTIDVFTNEAIDFADRLQHLFTLRGDYQWLPRTGFHAQVSQGIYGALGDGTLGGIPYKNNSFPLRLQAGANTALTTRMSLSLDGGWNWGFYDVGDSFSSYFFSAKWGYEYSPQRGRIGLIAQRVFQDSINANFYRDWDFQAFWAQSLDPIYFSMRARFILRSYQGLSPALGASSATREDLIVYLDPEARYNYRDWLSIFVRYRLAIDETDFRYDVGGGTQDDPSFNRHEVFAGVTASF